MMSRSRQPDAERDLKGFDGDMARLFCAVRSLELALDEELERSQLSRTQYRVLALLRVNGELTVGETRKQLGLSGPTVWAAIRSLSDRKLVKTKTSPDDARARILSLSKAGVRQELRLSDSVRAQLGVAARRVGNSAWGGWRRATEVLAERCLQEMSG